MNYFLKDAVDKIDLLGSGKREAALVFQAPNGHTFELPVSPSQLSLVLSNVLPGGAEEPARSPTKPRRRQQQPAAAAPLSSRGVVDEQPEDPDISYEDEDLEDLEDEDDGPPIVLRSPSFLHDIDEEGL